jgi:hypothetical protein
MEVLSVLLRERYKLSKELARAALNHMNRLKNM